MKDLDAPAIVAPWGVVRYAALHALADAWATEIRSIGIGSGQVVALRGAAGLPLLGALLGAWRVGAWAMPLEPKLPNPILVQRVELTGARVLDVDVLAGRLGDGALSAEPLISEAGGVLVATSGTMGAPKLAMLTTRALLANARRSNANIPVGAESRWLLSLPLHHVSGLGVLQRAWVGGGAVALPNVGQALAASIEALRPTHASLVATQLRRLLAEESLHPTLAAMEAILLGGSAIPRDLIDSAHAAGLLICKSYGLTEMGSQVATTRPGAPLHDLYTSGAPLAPDSVRIDANGEISVRGDSLFSGYWGADGAPQLPLDSEGWYATGDLGHFDAVGRLVVIGRRDSMFVSGGENVHPEAVERVLGGLPGVEQAVVVSVPDAEFVALGVAFVAMSGGAEVDAESIRAQLKASLSAHQVPRYVFAWPADLLEAGIKPNRRALQTRAEVMVLALRG